MLLAMKIWFKLLTGSILGVLLGFLLPYDNQTILNILEWLEKLAIRIGRYATVPLLVFSLTLAIYELRQDGQFWRLFFRSFLMILGAAVFVVTAGILVTMLFPPARIPISKEDQIDLVTINIPDSVMELFPSNMFNALVSEGVYLLPVYVLAFFLGIGLSYDRNYSKPVISLIDSLSRIFYHVASFFSEIMGFIIIVLGAYWAIRFHGILKAEIFRDLIVLLGVFSAVLGFGILPLLLYFIRPRTNPWVRLYGTLGPALTAFFSGDINFSLPVIFRHVKENLGARRRANAVTVTLFTSFGRAGSATVAVAAFIVIIKSYSSLGVTMMDVLSIGVLAVAFSFLLARHPGDGAYTVLAAICLSYGRGFEAGYLILKPIAFYLIAVGTFLDVMIVSFSSYALAKTSGFQEDKNIRHFI
jgi:Na+/H+-dicarboxylate symporter